MELEDDSSTNFIPEHLLRILTAIESDGTHLPWKLIRNSSSFTLIVNFRAKGNDKGKQSPLKKRASGVNFASQHTDKKRQDSSDVGLAEKPKRKKKKTPAQVARDRARRKAYWKNIKVARKLRAENFAAHRAKLREAGKEASLQFYTVVSQPESENSGCLERTPSASQPNRRLTAEGDCFNTAQVQSDLNRLSAEAAEEHPSILVDNSEDSEVVCARCLKKGKGTELRRCAGCKSFSYCNKDCQRLDWPSHRQLCKSIQSLNPQN